MYSKICKTEFLRFHSICTRTR